MSEVASVPCVRVIKCLCEVAGTVVVRTRRTLLDLALLCFFVLGQRALRKEKECVVVAETNDTTFYSVVLDWTYRFDRNNRFLKMCLKWAVMRKPQVPGWRSQSGGVQT
eukprot:5862319-Amphidinium_carterae.1